MGCGGLYQAGGGRLDLLASVLHMRGLAPRPQPLIGVDGNVLLWNGEVFGGEGVEVDEAEGDTAWVLAKLQALETEALATGVPFADLFVATMSTVHGPWALVYWQAATQQLWFGRDRVGRRSLVARTGVDGWSLSAGSLIGETLVLCSQQVGDDSGWQEVPTSGLFHVSMDDSVSDDRDCVVCHTPWPERARPPVASFRSDATPALVEAVVVDDAANVLLSELARSVCVRVASIPPPRVAAASSPEALDVSAQPSGARVGVLFSGGLDCMVIAALLHFFVPKDEPIDLINVCFDAKHASPDRITAVAGVTELRRVYPSRHWQLIRVDAEFSDALAAKPVVWRLVRPCDTHMDFNIGSAFWFASRGIGRSFVHKPLSGADSDVAIAVRGMLAAVSSGTAAAASESSDSIAGSLGALDLGPSGSNAAAISRIRDRVVLMETDGAGKASEEPQAPTSLKCCGEKCSRFIKASCVRRMCAKCCRKATAAASSSVMAGDQDADDVMVECRAHRQSPAQIAKAVAAFERRRALRRARRGEQTDDVAGAAQEEPASHTDDPRDSTGAAAEGGAGGAGGTAPPIEADATAASVDDTVDGCRAEEISVVSTARALLLGIGADEQMAGYGRHRTAFKHRGWEGLQNELQLDVERLWRRNLGRDDRCCCCHGRETRLPYLDESVTALLSAFPLPVVADLRLPRGEGDKRLLRRLASSLGLGGCSTLPKRAIQFGSRLAKQSNVHSFGSNRQATGDAAFDAALP